MTTIVPDKVLQSLSEALGEPLPEAVYRYSRLRRIAWVGLDARLAHAVTDMDYPAQELIRRNIIIIVRDNDIYLLQGYRPEEIAFIPVVPTWHQRSFLASRRHEEISLEDARTWIRMQKPGR